jgi:hypothetical protein
MRQYKRALTFRADKKGLLTWKYRSHMEEALRCIIGLRILCFLLNVRLKQFRLPSQHKIKVCVKAEERTSRRNG